ncbi:hypothetical protein E2320_021307, partial [Naja naja]
MECVILDALEALGYEGPLLDEDALNKAAECGLASKIFVSFVIQPLCNLEESISSTAGGEDVESLQLEMSGFLKELACPYSTLVSGEIKDRLKKKEDCLKVLLFLSTELQALQILQFKQCKGSHLAKNDEVLQEIQMICDVLGVPKSASSDFYSLPVSLNNIESKKQLEKINEALLTEYECRRRMLMKRLDVTVQSFGWSDRAKVKTDDIARIYQPKRYGLTSKSTISIAHLLAAREDLSKITRTSSGSTREKTICAINKIVAEDQQKLIHRLLKCPHGRRDRMVVVEEEGEVGEEMVEEEEVEEIEVAVDGVGRVGGVEGVDGVGVVEEGVGEAGGEGVDIKGGVIIVGEEGMGSHMVEEVVAIENTNILMLADMHT